MIVILMKLNTKLVLASGYTDVIESFVYQDGSTGLIRLWNNLTEEYADSCSRHCYGLASSH